jgi:uncharacterized protein YjdB
VDVTALATDYLCGKILPLKNNTGGVIADGSPVYLTQYEASLINDVFGGDVAALNAIPGLVASGSSFGIETHIIKLIELGYARVTDANGRPLATDQTPNPQIPVTVDYATSGDGNMLYVWVQPGTVTITKRSETSTVIPLTGPSAYVNTYQKEDRDEFGSPTGFYTTYYYRKDANFTYTLFVNMTPGSADLRTDGMIWTPWPDNATLPSVQTPMGTGSSYFPPDEIYEYFIITNDPQMATRTSMYLWPQVIRMTAGGTGGLGIQGTQRFGDSYAAFSDITFPRAGSGTYTLQVLQMGNKGFSVDEGEDERNNFSRASPDGNKYIVSADIPISITEEPIPPGWVLGSAADEAANAGGGGGGGGSPAPPAPAPEEPKKSSAPIVGVEMSVAAIPEVQTVAVKSLGIALDAVATEVVVEVAEGYEMMAVIEETTDAATGKKIQTIKPKREGRLKLKVKSRDGKKSASVTIDILPEDGAPPGQPGQPPTTPSTPTTPTPAPIPLTELRLRTTANVAVGRTMTLIPYVSPVGADQSRIIWVTSDAEIATVVDGVVTGVKTGKATITALDPDDGLLANCTVTVRTDTKPVTSIKFGRTELTIAVGTSRTALSVAYSPSAPTFKGVSWKSSDENIVRVEPNGKIVAVAPGKAVITAISDSGNRRATCIVSVVVPVESVALPETKITLRVGASYTLQPIVYPSNATDKTATYTTGSTAIATVSSRGVVTAKKAGTTTITVKVGSKTAKVTVVVQP